MASGEVTKLLNEEKEWARISKQLTLYAHKKLGQSYERARELSQEAITRLWEPKYIEWDPARHTLIEHLMRMVNSLVVNERRLHKKKERWRDDDELAELHYHDDSPGNLAEEKEKKARAYAMLAEEFRNNDLASATLDLVQAGVDTPAAVAEALGEDITRVRNVWRTIALRAEKVAREMEL